MVDRELPDQCNERADLEQHLQGQHPDSCNQGLIEYFLPIDLAPNHGPWHRRPGILNEILCQEVDRYNIRLEEQQVQHRINRHQYGHHRVGTA
jgi:hypothetical protein